MQSIPLQSLSRQGFSSAGSSSSAQPENSRSAAVGEVSPSGNPESSPGPSLRRQQGQQQLQHRTSQERGRIQASVITQQTLQVVQQTPVAQPQQQQQAQQNNNDRSIWSTIIKERGFEVAVFGLVITLVMMAPTFGQYATGVWSTAQTYQAWCKDEQVGFFPEIEEAKLTNVFFQSANHTLTHICSLIVDRPLPPPPGLNQVFKDVGRREVAVIAPRAPSWEPLTDEERGKFYAFLRGPVGNGISLMAFGFWVLTMRLEDQKGTFQKWLNFALVLQVFKFSRRASLLFALRNVCLLMDWASWLRKLGIKAISLSFLAVLPVLFAVGYMNEKSFGSQIAIAIISALVVGDDYTHKLLPVFQYMAHFGFGE
jgi:hypothetical protein